MWHKVTNENNKILTDFLIADFKDLSEKLESTDKKVQFSVQLYITLITAGLAALSTNLLKGENTQVYFYMLIFMVICSGIGEFILFYMLSGQKIHFEYVNRLNCIRHIILENNNKSNKFIQQYGYTKPIPPKPTGMTYWMIYLICTAISLFVGGAGYFYNKQNIVKFDMPNVAFLIFIISFINMCIIVCHHNKLKDIFNKYKGINN